MIRYDDGMRWLVLASALMAFAACKKPKRDPPAPAPTGPPKVGHGTFKTGSNGSGAAPYDGGVADSEPVDAAPLAKPAYRDDEGHIHGPGGGVYMGSGPDCDASRDHCMRDGVWFAVGNIIPGRLFRATPVYEFEKKWYTWRGEEDTDGGKLFRTKMVGDAPLAPGTTIVWISADPDDSKWVNSEYEALTTSRWEAGVVDAAAGKKVRVKGWGDVPRDTVRVIVETKTF